jgi:E3 ubiquitin-protein ligase TRIP12
MEAIKHIEVDGAKLEDLCLDFTLPGDATYELKVKLIEHTLLK